MAIDISQLEEFESKPAPVEKAVPKVQPKAATPKIEAKPLDYSKISEQAVYDLSVPIQAIEHSLPEHLIVTLKDPNYVARWVHQSNQRIGTMKSVGYTFVTKEDLAEELKIDIEDENGKLKYIDVILMKCPKDRYFGQLRANHQRSLAQTNQAKRMEAERHRIDIDLSQHPDYQDYANAGKMGIF